MTDYFIIIVYFFMARYLVLKTRPLLIRQLLGPMMGGIFILLMGLGLVTDSFSSFLLIFPGAVYLILLPARLESRAK